MGTTSSARHRAHLSGLLAGLLVAGSLVSGLPAAAESTQARPLIDLVRVENGTRDALDGGDFSAVIVGNQAFGVIYGSKDRPLAAVTLFTVVVRSFGTATVHDADTGRVLASDVNLPFFTLVAEKLDAAFEFRDQNGDGIFNFRPNLETRDPFDFNASEPALKGVPLAGDWNITAFAMEAVSDDQVNVTWVLTIQDLPYRAAFDEMRTGDGLVNKVEFALHVSITRRVVEGASIPHFDATVDRDGGRRTLTALEADGTTTANYTSTRAVFKVDHDIVGWDFAPPRLDVQSRLMLHATILYANAVPGSLAPWMSELAFAGERGAAANVSADHDNTTVSPDRPMSEFKPANSVGLRDGFGPAGSLRWVPTVTVWPTDGAMESVDKDVRFQVLGGARFAGAVHDREFKGFVLSAGFIYPAGYRLYHDPEIAAESVEVEGNSFLPAVLPALTLVGEAALVIAAMAGALAVVARAAGGAAKARAADEARRLAALKARYSLPPVDEPPRGGG